MNIKCHNVLFLEMCQTELFKIISCYVSFMDSRLLLIFCHIFIMLQCQMFIWNMSKISNNVGVNIYRINSFEKKGSGFRFLWTLGSSLFFLLAIYSISHILRSTGLLLFVYVSPKALWDWPVRTESAHHELKQPVSDRAWCHKGPAQDKWGSFKKTVIHAKLLRWI